LLLLRRQGAGIYSRVQKASFGDRPESKSLLCSTPEIEPMQKKGRNLRPGNCKQTKNCRSW